MAPFNNSKKLQNMMKTVKMAKTKKWQIHVVQTGNNLLVG